MNFDRSITLQGGGAGVVLTSPDGQILKYAVQLDFRATNNKVEYEGLLAGLRVAAGWEFATSWSRGTPSS
jgi:ribonuclease HI